MKSACARFRWSASPGAFIGMVMAIETYQPIQGHRAGRSARHVINLSVVKQIGPVLAAVMLAGRVAARCTAELGTMNVTEQLDALRVMGTDPIRYLVVPRFLACVLLTPMLTIYSDLHRRPRRLVHLRRNSSTSPTGLTGTIPRSGVDTWQIFEGIIKSFFFGGAIGLISCYKGFTSGAGASGVGRACTESFVASFIAIIVINFFFAEFAKRAVLAIYGIDRASLPSCSPI